LLQIILETKKNIREENLMLYYPILCFYTFFKNLQTGFLKRFLSAAQKVWEPLPLLNLGLNMA